MQAQCQILKAKSIRLTISHKKAPTRGGGSTGTVEFISKVAQLAGMLGHQIVEGHALLLAVFVHFLTDF